MKSTLILAALLFIAALLTVRSLIVGPRDSQIREPKALRIIRGTALAVAFTAFGVFALCSPHPIAFVSRHAALFVGLLGIVAIVVYMLASQLWKHSRLVEPHAETLDGLARAFVRKSLGKVAHFARTAAEALKPLPGSAKEIQFSTDIVDRLFGFRAFVKWHYAVLLVSILFAISGAIISFHALSDSEAGVMKAMVGYNALFIFSILTVAIVETATVMFVLRSVGVIKFPISVAKSLKLVTTLVGYGTLAGAFGAALSPVLGMVFIKSTTGIPAMLLPSVLIELPASGAILGYMIGLIIAVMRLGFGSTNHYYKYLLSPGIFVVALECTFRMGLTPELFFHQFITEGAHMAQSAEGLCSMTEPNAEIRARVSDPVWRLSVSAHCDAPAVVDGKAVVRFGSAFAVAAAAIAWFRNRWISAFQPNEADI